MAEDGFPADQFVKGWAGRGGDMEVDHGDPAKPPKMQRTSHRAPDVQIRAKWQSPEQGERGEGPHLGVQDRVEFQPHCVVTERLSRERETHSSGATSTEGTCAPLPTKKKSMRPRPAGLRRPGVRSWCYHCSLACGRESQGTFLGFPAEVRPPKVSDTVLPGIPTPGVWVQPHPADHPSHPTLITQFPSSQDPREVTWAPPPADGSLPGGGPPSRSTARSSLNPTVLGCEVAPVAPSPPSSSILQPCLSIALVS